MILYIVCEDTHVHSHAYISMFEVQNYVTDLWIPEVVGEVKLWENLKIMEDSYAIATKTNRAVATW